MIIPLSNLKQQHSDIKDEIYQAIKEVIDDSSFIMGSKIQDFEAKFSNFSGVKYTIGMSSGTSALHAALMALDVQPGDEVITVPFTFAVTVEAICHAGAKPVFVDIDSTSFTIDVTKIENAITDKTKVIILDKIHYKKKCG